MSDMKKAIAITCLETLDVYKPYVRKFSSKAGIPCFFENYAGFYADQEPELMNKIAEIEQQYGCLVYAITHEITSFGELWSMLCVPSDAECLEDVLDSFSDREYYAFAYVWNKSDDLCSEFGDVVVQSRFGGIKRVH
jgi:hypothetical protein